MKKFSDFIKKSAEPQKKEPASNVIKGRFKIAKSDDDKHLAFGWANVAIRADGEEIEDWQDVYKRQRYRLSRLSQQRLSITESYGLTILSVHRRRSTGHC